MSPPRRSSGKRIRGALVYIAVTALVTLALLEIGVRLAIPSIAKRNSQAHAVFD